MRQRLLLEEYHSKIVQVAGIDNNIVGTLSYLNITADTNDIREWGEKNKRLKKMME